MTKANQVSRLKKKLDKAWSLAVRTRDKFTCCLCGAKKGQKTKSGGKVQIHAHHWYLRKARSLFLRWDTDNGVSLCYHCHLMELHGSQSDYIFLDKYMRMLAVKFESEIGYLLTRSQSDYSPTLKWMSLHLEDLNEIRKQK